MQVSLRISAVVRRTFREKFLCAAVCRLLTVVFLFGNVAFAHRSEATFWENRRDARSDLAFLAPSLPLRTPSPSSFIPAHLPSASVRVSSSRLSRSGLPGSFLLHVNLKTVSTQEAGQPIIIIEDVHENREAQTHISDALAALAAESPADYVIGLEGASGPFIYDSYQQFPDEQIRRAVADGLFNNGQISGPAHAGLSHDPASASRLTFYGVDSPALYRRNVAAYQRSHALKPRLFRTLAVLRRDLEEKAGRFNPALSAFHQSVEAYRAGSLPMGDYAKSLAAVSPSPRLAVAAFLEAYALEKSLDFQRVERERDRVVYQLVRKIKDADWEHLKEESLAYQAGALSYAAFYSSLRTLCESNGVKLAQFPQFEKFIQYALLSDSLNADELFRGLTDMERSAYLRFAESSFEKKAVEDFYRLSLIDKLIQFQLTQEEWRAYAALPKLRSISAALRTFEVFYESAEARNEAMVQNLFAQNKDRAVLVVGGFHTAGISRILKAKNRNFIVVTPKLTRVEQGTASAYLSVFDREKTPLEQIAAGKQLFVSPPQAGAKTNLLSGVADPSAGRIAILLSGLALSRGKLGATAFRVIGEIGRFVPISAKRISPQAVSFVWSGRLVRIHWGSPLHGLRRFFWNSEPTMIIAGQPVHAYVAAERSTSSRMTLFVVNLLISGPFWLLFVLSKDQSILQWGIPVIFAGFFTAIAIKFGHDQALMQEYRKYVDDDIRTHKLIDPFKDVLLYPELENVSADVFARTVRGTTYINRRMLSHTGESMQYSVQREESLHQWLERVTGWIPKSVFGRAMEEFVVNTFLVPIDWTLAAFDKSVISLPEDIDRRPKSGRIQRSVRNRLELAAPFVGASLLFYFLAPTGLIWIDGSLSALTGLMALRFLYQGFMVGIASRKAGESFWGGVADVMHGETSTRGPAYDYLSPRQRRSVDDEVKNHQWYWATFAPGPEYSRSWFNIFGEELFVNTVLALRSALRRFGFTLTGGASFNPGAIVYDWSRFFTWTPAHQHRVIEANRRRYVFRRSHSGFGLMRRIHEEVSIFLRRPAPTAYQASIEVPFPESMRHKLADDVEVEAFATAVRDALRRTWKDDIIFKETFDVQLPGIYQYRSNGDFVAIKVSLANAVISVAFTSSAESMLAPSAFTVSAVIRQRWNVAVPVVEIENAKSFGSPLLPKRLGPVLAFLWFYMQSPASAAVSASFARIQDTPAYIYSLRAYFGLFILAVTWASLRYFFRNLRYFLRKSKGGEYSDTTLIRLRTLLDNQRSNEFRFPEDAAKSGYEAERARAFHRAHEVVRFMPEIQILTPNRRDDLSVIAANVSNIDSLPEERREGLLRLWAAYLDKSSLTLQPIGLERFLAHSSRPSRATVSVVAFGQVTGTESDRTNEERLIADFQNLRTVLERARRDRKEGRQHDVVVTWDSDRVPENWRLLVLQLTESEGENAIEPFIVVDLRTVPSQDGVHDYRDIFTAALIKASDLGLHTTFTDENGQSIAVRRELPAVTRLVEGKFDGLRFQSFTRVPGAFSADLKLAAIWTIFANMGLGWVQLDPVNLDQRIKGERLALKNA